MIEYELEALNCITIIIIIIVMFKYIAKKIYPITRY